MSESKEFLSQNGWEIPIERIPDLNPKWPVQNFPYDIYPSPNNEYAVLVHTQSEIRMCVEMGVIVVFENNKNPMPLEGIEKIGCSINFKKNDIKWLNDSIFSFNTYTDKMQLVVVFCNVKEKIFTTFTKDANDLWGIDIEFTGNRATDVEISKFKYDARSKKVILKKYYDLTNFHETNWNDFPLSAKTVKNTVTLNVTTV